MSIDKQKWQERVHLDEFHRACPDFPPGEIEALDPPAPDFFVGDENNWIGIEVLEFYTDSGKNESKPDKERRSELKEREVLQQRVVNHSKVKYATQNGEPIRVAVGFNDDQRLVGRDSERVADLIVTRVLESLDSTEEHSFVIKDGLPAQVSSLLVFRDQRKSMWSALTGGFFCQSPECRLQGEINVKNSNYACYRKSRENCSQVWLLVVADLVTPASWVELSEGLKSHCFESAFDKTFLFQQFDQCVTKLNTKPPMNDRPSDKRGISTDV